MRRRFVRTEREAATLALTGMPNFSARQAPVAYLFSLDSLAKEVGENAAFSLLSKSEFARLTSMRRRRRLEFLFGRFVLRALLAQRCHVVPGKVHVCRNKFGKPVLTHGVCAMPPHFSISHARDLLAVALSEHAPIGVDVEWTSLRLLDQAINLSRELFHQSELQRLIHTKTALRAGQFCRMWTLKEAAIKAMGRGLGSPIHQLLVADPAPDYHIDTSSLGSNALVHAWHWDGLVPGLHLAVATKDDSTPPHIELLHTNPYGLHAALVLEQQLARPESMSLEGLDRLLPAV